MDIRKLMYQVLEAVGIISPLIFLAMKFAGVYDYDNDVVVLSALCVLSYLICRFPPNPPNTI